MVFNLLTTSGWIENVFILPMIKSHLINAYNLTDQQVSFLLSTKSFKAMVCTSHASDTVPIIVS